MRFVTLDRYDGTAWRADNRTVDDVEDDLFQRIGSEVAASLPGEDVEVNVEMRGAYTGAWLPLVGQLTGVEFDFADGRAQREDVRYNPATSSAMVVGGLGPGDDYTFTASVPNTKLAKNSQAYPVDAPLQSAGQRLDEYLEPYVRSGRDPLTQVLLLARYLQRNGRYSDGTGALNVPPGHDINRLAAQFIGARRIVGNDEQYAAFMALAANRLRVPARVVVGTLAKDGKVRGKDVVAWVELRVRDGSWRILPTSTFMSHRKPSRDDEPPQSLEEFVQDQLPGGRRRTTRTRRSRCHSRTGRRGPARIRRTTRPPCRVAVSRSRCSSSVSCGGGCPSPRRPAGGGGVIGVVPRDGWRAPGGRSSTPAWTWAVRSRWAPPARPRRLRWGSRPTWRGGPTTWSSVSSCPRSTRSRSSGRSPSRRVASCSGSRGPCAGSGRRTHPGPCWPPSGPSARGVHSRARACSHRCGVGVGVRRSDSLARCSGRWAGPEGGAQLPALVRALPPGRRRRTVREPGRGGPPRGSVAVRGQTT